jgi:uncharacterized protein
VKATIERATLSDEQPIETRDAGIDGEIRTVGETPISLLGYLVAGIVFGILLTKSEAVSWFRIQEMFRFRSFHMYGIMGSAVLVGAISLQLIRRLGVRSLRGEPITLPRKTRTPLLKRYWMGGTVFGAGWGLLGACPGPIFALMGTGLTVMIVGLASALAGTYAYAWVSHRLPH